LPVRHRLIIGGPLFRRDVRIAALMGRLTHPTKWVVDIFFTDRRRVAPAGELDQRLQVGHPVASSGMMAFVPSFHLSQQLPRAVGAQIRKCRQPADSKAGDGLQKLTQLGNGTGIKSAVGALGQAGHFPEGFP